MQPVRDLAHPSIASERTITNDARPYSLQLLCGDRFIYQLDPIRGDIDRPIGKERIQFRRAVQSRPKTGPLPIFGTFHQAGHQRIALHVTANG